MKHTCFITALIIATISSFGQNKNWLDYKENFYTLVLENYVENHSDKLEKIIEGNMIYGMYNDVSLNDDIDFDVFFLRVLSDRELRRELIFQKKDHVHLLKVWPLSINKEGKFICSVSLYRISIHYALPDTLNLEHIETEQYVFDLKECMLELVD